MKERTFSTSEICHIFNIGRETLRHYENIGILTPTINAENGYREYGYWEVGIIVDILKYKSMGLSLGDTRTALFDMDFGQLIEGVRGQEDFYEKRAIQDKMMAEILHNNYMALDYAREHLNELIETEIPEMIHIPFRSEPDSIYYESMIEALKYSQFFSTAWILGVGNNSPYDGIGLAAQKSYADILKIENGLTIPAAKAVGTVMDITGRDKVTDQTFKEFNEKVKEKYPNTSDATYAVLLSRFSDKEKRYHQYFSVYKKLL